MVRHALRAALPTLAAVAVVLAMRALESGTRGLGIAVAEVAAYALVTVIATVVLEGRLLAGGAAGISGRDSLTP